jgi:hypothetical protein
MRYVIRDNSNLYDISDDTKTLYWNSESRTFTGLQSLATVFPSYRDAVEAYASTSNLYDSRIVRLKKKEPVKRQPDFSAARASWKVGVLDAVMHLRAGAGRVRNRDVERSSRLIADTLLSVVNRIEEGLLNSYANSLMALAANGPKEGKP